MYKPRRRRFKTTAAIASVVVMALAYSAGVTAATPGVNAKTITMGAILSLTGVFASGAKAQLAGMHLYWDKVNANGGVCDGRTIKIAARDHHYNVQQAVTAYSGIHNQILAIQGLTGTPMSKALAPRMAAQSVVAIPMSFSPVLLDRGSILIPGSTYDVDMVNAVDYLVQTGALKKGDTISYVYFPGGYGGAGLNGAKFAAEKQGITVLPFQVTPSVSDLSAQIREMVSADVDAMFMSVSPPLLANAAAVSHTEGLDIPIVVPGPNFVPALMESSAAEQIADRVMVASAYNAWSADMPTMNKVRAMYEKTEQNVDPQQFMLLGYVASEIMHSALQSVCAAGDLTRQNLLQAFSEIKSFDLNGLAVDVSYLDRSMPPSIATYIVQAKQGVAGGLVPLMDTPFTGENVQAYVQSKYK